MTLQKPTLRFPDVSNSLEYMSNILSFLVNGSETEGGFTLLRYMARPGGEPPAHVHLNEHECMYVLEGCIDFYVEGAEDVIHAQPGSAIHFPRAQAHAMVFLTSEVKALATLHAVGGKRTIEGYLRSMAIGPANSMQLPKIESQYVSLSPEDTRNAAAEAKEYGMIFLSAEEISKRLPNFPEKKTKI